MRSFIVMGMFVASFAQAGWNDYEETRELTLNGVNQLNIKAGAGSMDVFGVDGSDEILVKALIVVPGKDEERAQREIEKKMVLSLEQRGDAGYLDAWFEDGLMSWGNSGYIVLEVNVPSGMTVAIEDSAGSIEVRDVAGDVSIDDGSGSIKVAGVANLTIDDGSGSIKVDGATGDVSIVDGSGSITVRHVGGSVTVDDGSGGI
ncbi:MAG: hypothetical protein AAFN50_11455, partial [Pseudomonadota bacterium]